MKGLLKKSLALLLALTMVFGAAPLAGFVGIELPSLKDIFADKAEAATYGVLTYEINDGEVTITDCDTSASGELVIPDTIEGYPITNIGDWAFSSCTELTNISIPSSITNIGNYAFYNCSGLTSVTIPDGVTSIGVYAFRYCSSLKSVTIPDNVVSIGTWAFAECTSLTSLTIGNSVTTIGDSAFEYCSGLTSVTIPDNVTNIGDYVFSYCNNLSNIKIGKGLAIININVFVYCNKLNSITVDENNKYYSSDEYGVLFNKDKTNLIRYPNGNERSEYIIPNTVTSIGDSAFNNCDSLTSVTIPESVTSIGNGAFAYCDSLTSITIPNSVTNIGSNVFGDCNSLKKISVDDSNQYYSSDEYGAFFNNYKSELIQYPIGNERAEYVIPNSVTSIGNSAFSNCDSLTSVTIPDSVTSVGEYAFYNCSELVNIKIGNGIKRIDNSVFFNSGYYNNEENWVDNVLYIDNCLIKAKTDISGEYSIKEGTRIIADEAFYNCSSLTSILIPGSVKYIGRYAFSGCSSLSSAILENGIVDIEDYAFRTCISLTSISIPDSVEKIGTNAFYGCLNLKTVSIGSGIKSIGRDAFAETGYYINEDNWVKNVLYIDNCLIKTKNNITGNYAIKDGATVIADYAFSNCDNLADVTIPDSVTNIGDSAFDDCYNLTINSNSLPSGLTSIGDYAFYSCYKLTIDSLPSGLSSIGDYAFYSCDSLTSVTIPNSVTSIDYYAFGDCDSLTSVIIPESVTSVGDYAFENCNSLKAITVDESNQYYSSDEYGALFNKNKAELIQYPVGNERTEYIIPNSVTGIGDSAFQGCFSLTNVTIPESVTSIGNNAFQDCYSLTSVTIPESVTSIGYYAFEDCDSLTSVTIPNSVTSVGDYAFGDCDSLTSVIIPESVTSVGDYAFENCNSLKAITVDESNQYYSSDEYGALFNKNKTELIQYPVGNERTEYIIPNSVTGIGDSAFAHCNCLKNVTISGSVTSIGDYVFYSCYSLTSVTIPNGVTRIGMQTFRWCYGLTIVTIPASVTYIGSDSFSNCNNLEGIFVDDTNSEYSSDNFGVLFNKDKTELIQYPVGNARTSYTVPEAVETIESDSFEHCKNLLSITIPKSVSSIYGDAFYSCDNLNTVYYSGSPSMWEKISISWGNDKLKNATIIYAEEDSETGEVKKETVSDETTDVSVEYISNFHEGEVGLEVERTFDGKAFDVISTQLDINSNEIYDIKMTIDGVATQPNGKVKVKIPIPAGYDPAKTFVYHVNTNTGTVENMNAVVEGNYLVFETDHFSYYAVVEFEESGSDEPVEQSYKITWNIDGKITEQKYKAGDAITAPQNSIKSGYRFVGWSPAVPATMPAYDLTFTAVFEKIETPIENIIKVSIRNPSTTTIDYGDSIILHADIDGTLPAGARIEWTADNGNFSMSVSADGMTCKISPKSNGKTVFTATVYDKDGNVISSDTQEMTAKAGLWQKIVAFFKKIFGLTKTIPEAFKGIF